MLNELKASLVEIAAIVGMLTTLIILGTRCLKEIKVFTKQLRALLAPTGKSLTAKPPLTATEETPRERRITEILIWGAIAGGIISLIPPLFDTGPVSKREATLIAANVGLLVMAFSMLALQSLSRFVIRLADSWLDDRKQQAQLMQAIVADMKKID
ncbi:MAG: hypothetical protein NTV51_26085 [Verrucomicrobia bacterium]|nr:hypothetical protein [Verrucomicrobiota bacterium]